MFGNTTSKYLYQLVKGHALEEKTVVRVDEDLDGAGKTIQFSYEYKIGVLHDRLSAIPYKNILQGIAHYEQGREPSIGQRVYFINLDKGIMFLMYDDRGCVVYSNSRDNLMNIYHKYNDWIQDYYRKSIDEIFGKA